MTEYYPTLKEVLELLGEDCILVGSATWKPESECKDFDFVINSNGVNRLLGHYGYYIYQEDDTWWQYIPVDAKGKCVDFFFGLCEIVDETKFHLRLTYEQASNLPLTIKVIGGVEVLSI